MATTAISAADATARIGSSKAKLVDNFETFLSLLTTQLKNQDPLSPMDGNQFTQQLVQMTGVEQQLLGNQLLSSLVAQGGATLDGAVNLIGKTVTADTKTTALTGKGAEWTYELAAEAADAQLTIKDSKGLDRLGRRRARTDGGPPHRRMGRPAAQRAPGASGRLHLVHRGQDGGRQVDPGPNQRRGPGDSRGDHRRRDLAHRRHGQGQALGDHLGAAAQRGERRLKTPRNKPAPERREAGPPGNGMGPKRRSDPQRTIEEGSIPMSINSSLLAGVSGLKANSAALAALSDNIANVNTVGYKRSQADFQTIVTARASQGAYNAGGVTTKTRQYIGQQGLLQQTNTSTDLGIQGSGFFVVTDKAEGVQPTDTRSFTRAGNFQLDQLGYLKNAAGLYLQGWPLDTEGNVLSDPSDLNRLQTINVTAIGGTAEPTTRMSTKTNLDSTTPISAAAAGVGVTPAVPGTYNSQTNSMAMYNPSAVPATGVKPDFEFQFPVSDSKGGRRSLAMSFLKSKVPNEWHVEIRAVPAGDVDVGGPTLNNGQVKVGKIVFTQDGRYDPLRTTIFGNASGTTPAAPVIRFGASSATLLADGTPPADGEVRWDYALGIKEQEVRFDFGLAAGGLSQAASKSLVDTINTNGTPFGNLTSININDEGFVAAEFDNGITRQIAQVAIATFGNTDAMKAISGNAFQVSLESGTYNLKAPGTGGAGFISPSTLESSTVDLSAEFTGLITTQRAYSASSKIITTADEMLEELLRIKR
jgi:flagellar hook protein FlgE